MLSSSQFNVLFLPTLVSLGIQPAGQNVVELRPIVSLFVEFYPEFHPNFKFNPLHGTPKILLDY